MKRLLTVIAFCATAFAAAGAFTTPAAADSGRHGSGLYTQGSNGHFVLSFFSGDRHHRVQRAQRRHHKMRRQFKFKHQHARQDYFPRHGQRLGTASAWGTPGGSRPRVAIRCGGTALTVAAIACCSAA